VMGDMRGESHPRSEIDFVHLRHGGLRYG